MRQEKPARKRTLTNCYTLHRTKKIRPAPITAISTEISPSVQRKIEECHSPEVERALEVAFRKLQADERVREEERREAILRAGSSPLSSLEPQLGGRARD